MRCRGGYIYHVVVVLMSLTTSPSRARFILVALHHKWTEGSKSNVSREYLRGCAQGHVSACAKRVLCNG